MPRVVGNGQVFTKLERTPERGAIEVKTFEQRERPFLMTPSGGLNECHECKSTVNGLSVLRLVPTRVIQHTKG